MFSRRPLDQQQLGQLVLARDDLPRPVAVGVGGCPDEGQLVVRHLLDEVRPLESEGVGGLLVGRGELEQGGPQGGEVILIPVEGTPAGQLLGELRVPVLVEGLSQLGDHGAEGEHVQVAKVDVLGRVEVFVPHVPAPDDPRESVGGEHLVVHPVVDPEGPPHEVQGLRQPVPRTPGPGIEQADLKVLMDVRGGEAIIDPVRSKVVDQEPHPHAAVRGLQEQLEQDRTRDVVVEDVVLDVDCVLRALDQRRPRGEGVEPVPQHVQPGVLPVAREDLLDFAADARTDRAVEGEAGRRRAVQLGVDAGAEAA